MEEEEEEEAFRAFGLAGSGAITTERHLLSQFVRSLRPTVAVALEVGRTASKIVRSSVDDIVP